MSKFLYAFVAASVLALSTTADAKSSGGRACFNKCRAELKRAGTWNSYPRGYCRRKCDYWAGAPPDVHR